MSYIDGFVIAVPAANRDRFIEHAGTGDPVFTDLGATRVVECWEDDVPDGKLTDFRRAVAAEKDEKVVFSWMEWPDKATRDAAFAKMTSMMDGTGEADPRMDPAKNPMPFDGRRMIMGGFEPILDRGGSGASSYTDGFVTPAPAGNKDAYLAFASKAAGLFEEFGAVRVVETWGDDVPKGERTDFHRAAAAEEGDAVVFSFIEWPDKATRDKGWEKMMSDERMKPDGEMPFDGKRMFWGGFTPVVDLGGSK